jgi:hypothetical protein
MSIGNQILQIDFHKLKLAISRAKTRTASYDYGVLSLSQLMHVASQADAASISLISIT